MFRDGAARLLVFRVGPELFGVDLEAVDEVVDAPAVHPLPDSPPGVLGVTSLRGTLLRIYDPTPVLRVGRAETAGVTMVFDRGAGRVGVAVDDVLDVMSILETDVQRAPGVRTGKTGLLGVVRRAGDLVAVFEAAALVGAAVAEPEGEGP